MDDCSLIQLHGGKSKISLTFFGQANFYTLVRNLTVVFLFKKYSALDGLILTIKSIVSKNRKLFKGFSYFTLSPQSTCKNTSQLGCVGQSCHYIAVQVILHWVKKSAFLEKKLEVLKHAVFSVYNFQWFSTLLREPRNNTSC